MLWPPRSLKVVKVNGSYKHGRYDKIWLKSLHVMSNIEVFATQDKWTDSLTVGWLSSQMNTTHCIDLYDAHMHWKQLLSLITCSKGCGALFSQTEQTAHKRYNICWMWGMSFIYNINSAVKVNDQKVHIFYRLEIHTIGGQCDSRHRMHGGISNVLEVYRNVPAHRKYTLEKMKLLLVKREVIEKPTPPTPFSSHTHPHPQAEETTVLRGTLSGLSVTSFCWCYTSLSHYKHGKSTCQLVQQSYTILSFGNGVLVLFTRIPVSILNGKSTIATEGSAITSNAKIVNFIARFICTFHLLDITDS